MIQFNQINIENFQLIDSLTLDFVDQGYVGITGKNGHGKSTITDAFMWVLTGYTTKGAKGDDILPLHNPKNTKVDLTWSEGATQYQIVRYRKHDDCPKETTKSGVFLYVDGQMASLPSDSMVNERIQDLIGADRITLLSTLVYAQENKPFTEMDEAAKQQILDQMLDTFWLSDMLKLAKQQLSQSEKDYDLAEQLLLNVIEQKKKQEKDLNGFRLQVEQKREEHEQRRQDIQESVSSYDDTLRKLQNTVEGLREKIDDFKKLPVAVQPDFTKKQIELSNLTENLNKVSVEQEQKLSHISTRVVQTETSITAAEARHAKFDRFGPECQHCEQEIGLEYRAGVLDELTQQIEAYQATVKELKAQHSKATEEGNQQKTQLKTKIATIEQEMADQQSVYDEYTLLVQQNEKDQASLTSSLKHIQQVKETRQALVEQLKNLSEMDATDDSHLETKTAEVKETEEKIEEYTQRISGLSRQKDIFGYWVKACGIKGVKNRLVRQTMPVLNSLAEHYAHVLCGGKVQVKFKPVKTLKSGRQKEGFFEQVLNHRGVTDYKMFSKGEKGLTNLIIALSFHDLVAGRATKNYNVCFLDEVTESLDSDNTSAVVNLLSDLARERGSVFVITHSDELKQYFQRTLTVQDGVVKEI